MIKAPDWQWLDAHQSVNQPELARLCGMSVAEIDELVEYGTLVPVATEAGADRRFSAGAAPSLREAARLRGDFDLDLFTTSLLFGYLLRIAHLEQQIRTLQAPPPHPQQLPREGPTPWREPHA